MRVTTSWQEVTGAKKLSIRGALDLGKDYLEGFAVPQPLREVQSLLEHLTGLSLAGLFLEAHRILQPAEVETFLQWLQRRGAGEPFSYILQNQPFWDETFYVSPGVFIPRPETELLVEETQRLIPPPKRGLDLCTGSGCLAISLTRLIPGLRMVAIDISKKALRVARENAIQMQVDDRIVFLEGDLFFPLRERSGDGPFDLVTANPPYVASEAFWTLPEGIRNFEPSLALLGGPQGREIIDKILSGVSPFLKPGGFLLMEVGVGQVQPIRHWLKEEGVPLRIEKTIRDLSGIERVMVFRKFSQSGTEGGIV